MRFPVSLKCHWNVNFLHYDSFLLKYGIASWLICLVMWANTRAVISLNRSQQENLAFFSELFFLFGQFSSAEKNALNMKLKLMQYLT